MEHLESYEDSLTGFPGGDELFSEENPESGFHRTVVLDNNLRLKYFYYGPRSWCISVWDDNLYPKAKQPGHRNLVYFNGVLHPDGEVVESWAEHENGTIRFRDSEGSHEDAGVDVETGEALWVRDSGELFGDLNPLMSGFVSEE